MTISVIFGMIPFMRAHAESNIMCRGKNTGRPAHPKKGLKRKAWKMFKSRRPETKRYGQLSLTWFLGNAMPEEKAILERKHKGN